MTQFTAGSARLKPLVTGNGLSIRFGAFHRRCRVKRFSGGGRSISYKRKLCASTVYASKSSPSPPSSSNAGEVFDEVLADDSELALDELSGVRGLVLDISYKSAYNIHTT